MITPRTLYLEAQQLTAYKRQGGQWISEAHFSTEPDDSERFSAYLQQHRHSTFRLLADLTHEELRLESIPRLRGQDRQALIERKLAQHFPDNLLRSAQTLGQEQGQPLKEKLRLSAFNQETDFTPWLTLLRQQEAQLSGIYSITQLIGHVLQKLGKTTPHCLVFMQEEPNLREFFLVGGQVHLSRVLPAMSDTAEQVRQESAKLQRYLLNQHLIARNENLPVYFLGKGTMGNLDASTLDFEHLPTPKTHAQLFLDALDNNTPQQQFANPEQRLASKLARIRLAAMTLAILCLGVTWPLASAKMQETERIQSQTKQLLAKERDLQGMLQAQAAASNAAPSSGQPSLASLRHISQRYDELQGAPGQPRLAFSKLSQVLERHPAIQLEKLDWQHTAEPGGHLNMEARCSDNPSATNEQRTKFVEDFVADLSVDRNSQVSLRPEALDSANNAPASCRFIVEIRPKS